MSTLTISLQRDINVVTGLGLAVVARIVEQLGGQLRVDSRLGEGSRFSFLIPFAVDEEDHRSASSPSTTSFNTSLPRSRSSSYGRREDQLQSLVQALASNHMSPPPGEAKAESSKMVESMSPEAATTPDVEFVKPRHSSSKMKGKSPRTKTSSSGLSNEVHPIAQLRVLIVEVCCVTCELWTS